MKRILVWDIPTRLFHWLLAGSFLGAFIIANLFDDDSPLFAVHMLLGGTILFMIALRVVWGFVGSRYAKFGSFVFGPAEVLAYVKGAVSGKGKRYMGHNPGSTMAIYAILGLLVAQVLTGVFMSSGEVFEELHEVIAWTLLAVVGVHIAGVIWHTVRHKENIALSMVTGRKEGEQKAAIPSARPVVAVVFVALTGLWAGGLYNGYDAAAGEVTLPVIGTKMSIGEGEEHEGGERGEEYEEYEEHDDDD